MRSTMQTAGLSLAILAGTAVPLAVASADTPPSASGEGETHQPRLAFLKSSALLGTKIANANGETIGTAKDLILDRGTGRIEYVVLSSGGFFGLGDKEVAVPYHVFGFDHDTSRLRLDVTPELIDEASVFQPGEWVELDAESWRDQLAKTYKDTVRAVKRELRDPFADGISDAEQVELEGVIAAVDRGRTINGVEQVTLTVRTESGDRRVVLGPAWFVMSQAAAPMRGDEASVIGYQLKRDDQDRIVAKHAVIGGDALALRDRHGTPRWDVTASHPENVSESQETPASPLVLLSDVVGLEAHARDEEGGEIADAVIEVRSGRVAMLALDPNEGFLGLGDTRRAVPWPIVAVGSDAVRLDADKNMLLASEAMPDDVGIYITEARRAPVYRVFQIDAAMFEPRERREWQAQRDLGGWSADSALAEAVEGGQQTTISGTARGMTTPEPILGVSEARAIRVETDDGTETVIIGPAWFVERQDLNLHDGDEITIEAKRIRINGREVLVARTLESGDRTIELWSGDVPVWDAS